MKLLNFTIPPALIQADFHIGDRFWLWENRCPKNQKIFFFQDKFFSLKAHAYYFSVLIYLATWRAAKLGTFTHFTSTNLSWCSQNINSLIYVYSVQIPSCFFMSAWSVVIALLCTTTPQKTFLYYPLHPWHRVWNLKTSFWANLGPTHLTRCKLLQDSWWPSGRIYLFIFI